jgi:hypothetical protein
MATKTATATTITLKHLAADIAEAQELSKKQAETILTDLVTMITNHLKKGERIRIVGLASSRSASVPPAWAATRPRAKPFRSRRARRSLSAPPRN